MRRLFFGVMALAAGCSGGEITAPAEPLPLESVVIEAQATMMVGDTARLRVILRDISHTQVWNRSLSFTSSDTTIATVDTAGVVTAHAQGYATITVTSEGKKAQTTIEILPLAAACPYNPSDYCSKTETFVLVSVNDQPLPVKSPYGVGEWDYDSDAGTWQLTAAMITLHPDGDFVYATTHRAASGQTSNWTFAGRYERTTDSVRFAVNATNAWSSTVVGDTLIEQWTNGTKFTFKRYWVNA